MIAHNIEVREEPGGPVPILAAYESCENIKSPDGNDSILRGTFLYGFLTNRLDWKKIFLIKVIRIKLHPVIHYIARLTAVLKKIQIGLGTPA